ncbi:MAG: TFIIB-type zinc ribbon-containing protein [Halolamina sp.]
MKLRGERECKECGTRWSYYETGEATCPNCGSLRSVGVEDERKRHTDSPAAIDLSPHRNAVADDDTIDEVAADVEAECRAYLRKRGFIHAGDLQPLDDTFLAVQELRAAIGDYSRDNRVGVERSDRDDDDVERYLLRLLTGADDGDRPEPDEVPDSLTAARGLACATAVEAYREDVAAYLDDNPDPEARRVVERIRDHEKRVSALDGDVPPEDAERLVDACRDLYRYLSGADSPESAETALASAADRLDRLE